MPRWSEETGIAPGAAHPGELAPRARRDALPEHTEYTDTGCEVHPTCLSCPLPRCRYDEPGGVRGVFVEYRRRSVFHLRRRGWTVSAIARRLGVSRRTVFRVLARGEGAGGDTKKPGMEER